MRRIIAYTLLALCVLDQLRDPRRSTSTSSVAIAGQARGRNENSATEPSSALVISRTVIPAGEQITLRSKILGEDRNVLVALPASYTNNNERYPVLYLTDAQWNFAHAQTTSAFLARNGLMPEVIVVGVTNPDRTRDLYSTRADFKHEGRTIPFPRSGNADQFLEFIAKELIRSTESSYRTSTLRILAGHSAGGNFALHSARMKPGLFQAMIVTSPWLAWDDSKELKELLPFIATTRFQVRNLFLSYANEGTGMKTNVDAICAALRSRNDPALHCTSRSYPDETHDSTSIKSYYDGLRIIFDGWDYPRDPKTNLLVGQLDDLKAHYARVGDRLGVSLAPPERLVNELGYQYLETGSFEPAVTAFRFNVAQHPESANAWDSLGEGLERLGKRDEAFASYRKAVALAERYHHRNLEDFRRHLLRLSATAP